MEHSKYKTIARKFNYYATIPASIEAMPKPNGRVIRRAVVGSIEETITAIRQDCDSLIDEIKTRGNNGLRMTPDIAELYRSMVAFLNVPTPNISNWERLKNVCLELVNQVEFYFPGESARVSQGTQNKSESQGYSNEMTNDKVKAEIMAMEAYKKAVEDKRITEPFIWNGTKVELSRFLVYNEVVKWQSTKTPNSFGHIDWSAVNNVWEWKKRKLSSDELRKAYNK